MIKVYKILWGSEGTDEVTFFKRGVEVQEGMIGNCLKSVFI